LKPSFISTEIAKSFRSDKPGTCVHVTENTVFDRIRLCMFVQRHSKCNRSRFAHLRSKSGRRPDCGIPGRLREYKSRVWSSRNYNYRCSKSGRHSPGSTFVEIHHRPYRSRSRRHRVLEDQGSTQRSHTGPSPSRRLDIQKSSTSAYQMNCSMYHRSGGICRSHS